MLKKLFLTSIAALLLAAVVAVLVQNGPERTHCWDNTINWNDQP
jgi:hypothetical protein